MKVDKTRFLFLTSAITAAIGAASGCALVSTSGGNADGGTTPTPDGATTGDGGSTSDASPEAATTSDASDSGAACLGESDAGSGNCSALGNGCALQCTDIVTRFKGDIALQAIDCVSKLPTCEAAELDIIACVDKSLANACTDPTATTFCTPLVTACNSPALTQAACEQVATGLTAGGRTTFTDCITEGGASSCTADPKFCIDSVKW